MPKSAISVSDPRLRLYGRWDRRDPTRAVTVNTGSYLQARFRGRGLAVRFDLSRNRAPIPNVAWQLDGGDWREAEIAAELPLAEGLYARDHTLMLMVRGLDEHQSRWSAPLVASVTLLGLSLTEGARLLDPPAEPGLRLEFLGDSITEGVLSHPERPGKTAWTWRTDGRAGYACQTALALGAQWRQCGFGRLGVLIEGNGGVPPAARSFPWFYAGAPRDDWQPHLVCVNQGTNDRSQPSGKFAHAYGEYLRVIRKGYPDAIIAAMRPFGGAHEEDILSEVVARNAAGDRTVYYIDTTDWLEPGDYADGVHPHAGGHARAAGSLVHELRRLLRAHGQ